jgi:site-specific recombinase
MRVARIDLLARRLAEWPELRKRFSACVGSVLSETEGLRLFAAVGLPNDRGLLKETADRLARRFLPTPPDHGDLASLISGIIRRPRDSSWIADIPLESIERLRAEIGDVWAPARESVRDSITCIATRIGALGISDELRLRSEKRAIRESPFFRLPRAPIDELRPLIADCRRQLELILEKLEHHGVSVDVVYCIDVISLGLERIETLLPLVEPGADSTARLSAVRTLLARVARARIEERSLRQLARANLRLLARKIIERAGHTGEHYVTATRREWWQMLGSAAGGGVLTAGTCVVKFLTKWGHYPLFVDGMLSAMNYAASFIVMQLLGFTLATKQPSMTAAALAGSIRERTGDGRLEDLVTMIARMSRSQLAAAIGNVGLVIPAALGFHLVYRETRGSDFLDAESARHVVESFHPLHTGTIPWAALTGVLLWLSSLAAGWLENWAVYRRLPEALEHHRAGRFLGRANMARVARFFARNISGFGGNLTLGFLLGMTPVLGVFFGLPLDVRHITLSTGALTLAACSLGVTALTGAVFQWACVGIAVIGLLNFGVSFVFALATALRARGISVGERFYLAGAVIRRFFRAPGAFFFPPRAGG